MRAMRPDFLVVCRESGFLLPITGGALAISSRRLNSSRDRYEGAILVSGERNVSEILRVDLAEGSLPQKLKGALGLGSIRVVVKTKKIEMGWDTVLACVARCATSQQSYSVWGYYYDSTEALEVSIKESRDFNDLIDRLHATNSDTIADKLM